MYNFSAFNGVPTHTIPNTAGNKLIQYGSLVLHDDIDMRVQMIEFMDGKKISVQSQSFANDGNFFNRQEKIQTIKIQGSVKKESRGELLLMIDEMKASFSKKKEYLKVQEGDWKRRVLCVVTGVDFKEKAYTVDWIQYTLTLQTYKYWEESEVQEVIIENVNSNEYSYWVARDGTAEAKMTTILAFTKASGIDEIRFSCGETSLIINETIMAGDNVTLDGENQRVLKNGEIIGFKGEIPVLKNTSNQIKIKTNGTSRNYNITTQYHLTYK